MSEHSASTETEFSRCHPWQQEAWNAIDCQYQQKRLPHALLLQGQAYSDIDSFALLLARYLLCSDVKSALPCGACKNCYLIKAGSHPEFQEITFALNDEGKLKKIISVEQIRELTEKMQKTAFQGGAKVMVIYPAEGMNPAATNALLKSLEEPPANTYFILVSYNPGRLLATVRSRCHVVDLPLPNNVDADQYLSSLIADKTQRQQLLSISGGNPLLVREWVAEAQEKDILNLGVELGAVLSGKTSPLMLAKQWQKDEGDHSTKDRVVWWWRWLLAELKQSACDQQSALALSPSQLLDFMQKLLVAKRQLESTANPHEGLLLESLLIAWHGLKQA